jgi:hypothetical protein
LDLAARYDLTIEQGATFERTFRWEDSEGAPVDISSYSVRMSIRSTRASTTPLATSTGGTPAIVIVKTGVTGVFTCSIIAFRTALLDFTNAVYDIELYTDDSPSVVYRIFQGNVTLSREVTKE